MQQITQNSWYIKNLQSFEDDVRGIFREFLDYHTASRDWKLGLMDGGHDHNYNLV